MDFRSKTAVTQHHRMAFGMSNHHTQDEEILLPRCYMPSPPRTKSLSSTEQLINVGLVKTHGRCLPIDLEFAPYQVDNVVFHFPLPPWSKPSRAELSPIDSAVYMPDLLAETAKSGQSQIAVTTPAENEQDERSKKRLRRETRADSVRRDVLNRPLSPQSSDTNQALCEALKSAKAKIEQDEKAEKQLRRKTKIDLPKRELPVDPLVLQSSEILPLSCEDFVAPDLQTVDVERQQALNRLEDKPASSDDSKRPSINVTKRQLLDTSPNQKSPPTRIGIAPPSRPAPPHPKEINPDFRSSSDALRRRAASIRRQRQEEPHEQEKYNPPKSRSRSRSRSCSNTNKAQILLGIHSPENSTIERLFDQAILEFQQQTPKVAEKMSQRRDIGDHGAHHRWANRNQRREVLDDQAFYTPGSIWRPAARVHTTRERGSEGSKEVRIGTAALANRLGLPIGAGAQLWGERKGGR